VFDWGTNACSCRRSASAPAAAFGFGARRSVFGGSAVRVILGNDSFAPGGVLRRSFGGGLRSRSVGQIPITGGSGWGTGPLDLSVSDHGLNGRAGNNARGPVDPAIFGIDATDVGADARTSDKEPTPEESKQIESQSKVIENSFIWYDGAAKEKLEELRGDLKKEDQPSWSEQIAAFVLESALGAGAQASGLALAEKVVSGEASREFMQNIFASGVTGGGAAGKAMLSGGHDEKVIETFIAAQIEGISQRQQGSQTEFIMSGRQKLKTVSQAADLAAACGRTNVRAAAAHQYQASRDSWVSYIAQQKFGSNAWSAGDVTTMLNEVLLPHVVDKLIW